MDRMKRYGLWSAGVLLLSGALLVSALGISAAQTGPGGTSGGQATKGPGMLGSSGGMMGSSGGMMGSSGGMMGGSSSMMGGSSSRMEGAGSATGGSMMGDVDRHFIEMMIPHHQAAVAMADLALQKAQHPALKDLAAAIKQTQTAEIAQMRTWYRQWYGVDVPTNANGNGCGMMSGMGMMGGAGAMGGDLSALTNAATFDQAFLQQMVPHHQMALMMTQMVLAHGQQPELKKLAQTIITGQSAEIAQMQSWDQQWYGGVTP